jgi:hypothetical protein
VLDGLSALCGVLTTLAMVSPFLRVIRSVTDTTQEYHKRYDLVTGSSFADGRAMGGQSHGQSLPRAPCPSVKVELFSSRGPITSMHRSCAIHRTFLGSACHGVSLTLQPTGTRPRISRASLASPRYSLPSSMLPASLVHRRHTHMAATRPFRVPPFMPPPISYVNRQR